MERAALNLLERIQHRAVALREKTVGYVHAIIWIDANQVGIEGSMVDLG